MYRVAGTCRRWVLEPTRPVGGFPPPTNTQVNCATDMAQQITSLSPAVGLQLFALGERVRRVRDGIEGIVHGTDLDGRVKIKLVDGSFTKLQKAENFASLDNNTAVLATKTLSRAPAGAPADYSAVRSVLDSIDADDGTRVAALESLVLKGKGAAARMKAAAAADAALAPSVARHLDPAMACGWQVRLNALRALKGCGSSSAAAHVPAILGAIEAIGSIPEKPTKLRESYTKELKDALKAAEMAVVPYIDGLIERAFCQPPKLETRVPMTRPFNATAYRQASDERWTAWRNVCAVHRLCKDALEACTPWASEAHVARIVVHLANPDEHVRQDALYFFECLPTEEALRVAPPHLDALTGLLHDADSSVRCEAVHLLGGFMTGYPRPVIADTKRRAALISQLGLMLHDDDKWVRGAVKSELESLADEEDASDSEADSEAGWPEEEVAAAGGAAPRAAERRDAAEALRRAADGMSGGVKTERPSSSADGGPRKAAKTALTSGSSSRIDDHGEDGPRGHDPHEGDAPEAEDEVEIVGERSWQERQAALRARAVDVESEDD